MMRPTHTHTCTQPSFSLGLQKAARKLHSPKPWKQPLSTQPACIESSYQLESPFPKCSWQETLTSFPSPAEDEVVCPLNSHCNAEMGGRAPKDKGAHVWLACVGIWGLVSILGEVFQFWGHSKGKGETEGRGWKKKITITFCNLINFVKSLVIKLLFFLSVLQSFHCRCF